MIDPKEVKKVVLRNSPLAKKSKISWNEFVKLCIEVSKFYHFPKNVTVCQAALESGRGTSPICRTKNNYFGFMAYTHSPSSAKKYSTALDSIIDYLELITKDPRYTKVLEAKNSIDVLKAIYEAGYATDPDYIQKITSLDEWKKHTKVGTDLS